MQVSCDVKLHRKKHKICWQITLFIKVNLFSILDKTEQQNLKKFNLSTSMYVRTNGIGKIT